MRKTLLFAVLHFIAALLLLQGCQDDDDDQDKLSISAISPENPYDEEVTLSGTGFDTDPAGIQVILMTSGGADATFLKTQIDNTTLKVKLQENVNFGVGYYGTWKLIKGVDEYIHPGNTTFKKALKIIEVNNISEGSSRIRPDNMIEVVSRGGEKVFITCSVAGVERKAVEQVTVTENFYTSFKFHLPGDFYASDNFTDTATAWVDVIVSEGAREVSPTSSIFYLPFSTLTFGPKYRSELSFSLRQDFKLGVLGGGQLGRMLIQSGIDFNIPFKVLDPDATAPCSMLAEFHHGKLTDFDTVLEFGSDCDVITIEIENVNTAALKELVKLGKKVYPQPEIIELIQDKRSQKSFYHDHQIPTADFILVEHAADLKKKLAFFPAVNKLGKEGYDGRGVQILKSAADLGKAFDAPGLVEPMIDFEKEISVIVARSEKGEIKTFPVVEMVFHPEQNLVEFLFAPADLPEKIIKAADDIARNVIVKLGMVGILAVEMFVTKTGEVLVNEVAPRPHNSGHQTIEANITSQYEQHLRAILNLPLGDTTLLQPSAMVNVLGEPGYTGVAKYQGFEEVVCIPGVHLHLYGKRLTKPFRKMGHITVVDSDVESLKKKANFVKDTFKVIA